MTHYPPDNSAVSESAFESVAFALTNAGLEQGIFGRHRHDIGKMTQLDPPIYPQPEFEARYSFRHAGLLFNARVQTLYGGAELSFWAWVLSESTPIGTEACLGSKLKSGFDVIASGSLERENGFYLHGPRGFSARRHLKPILKSNAISVPRFYSSRPPRRSI